jgi:protein-tyrosine phosphatase
MRYSAQGVSRSATIVIAYIMQSRKTTRLDAEGIVRAARKIISPNISFSQQLDLWQNMSYSLDPPSSSDNQQAIAAYQEYKAKYASRLKLRKQ